MKVLVVDDDELSLTAMSSVLIRMGHNAVQFESAETTYEYVKQSKEPLLIVMDWMMAGMDGPVFCELIRNTCVSFQPYIIVITAKDTIEDEVEALIHGADDFMTKPVHNKLFSAKLGVGIRVINQQIEIQNRYEAISKLAMYDELTGCLNRMAGYALAFHDLEKLLRLDQGGFIAMLDIDFFKKINDRYGHDVGDELLKKFVSIVKQSLRETDTFFRYGGEEFVVFSTGNDDGAAIMERVRVNVAESDFQVGNTHLNITVSIGLITFRTNDFNLDNFPVRRDLLTELIKAADIELYKAKTKGRNRVIDGDYLSTLNITDPEVR